MMAIGIAIICFILTAIVMGILLSGILGVEPFKGILPAILLRHTLPIVGVAFRASE